MRLLIVALVSLVFLTTGAEARPAADAGGQKTQKAQKTQKTQKRKRTDARTKAVAKAKAPTKSAKKAARADDEPIIRDDDDEPKTKKPAKNEDRAKIVKRAGHPIGQATDDEVPRNENPSKTKKAR